MLMMVAGIAEHPTIMQETVLIQIKEILDVEGADKVEVEEVADEEEDDIVVAAKPTKSLIQDLNHLKRIKPGHENWVTLLSTGADGASARQITQQLSMKNLRYWLHSLLKKIQSPQSLLKEALQLQKLETSLPNQMIWVSS